jgi:hypothetical protein
VKEDIDMIGRLSLGAAVALAGLAGAGAALGDGATYTATLTPLNAATVGSEATANATLTIAGDTLTITVDATGTPPDMMHLQHFHGFAEGDKSAHRPTAEADTTGDGIVDLIETEPFAGTTMVPFQGDPASMAIVADPYPKSDAEGSYHYVQEGPLSALTAAFEKAFPDQPGLDLDRRVIFLHGVPETMALPDTVQSLGDVPAQVTIPIACGEIHRAEG